MDKARAAQARGQRDWECGCGQWAAPLLPHPLPQHGLSGQEAVTYRPPRKTAGVDPASWAFGARKVGGQPLDHRRQPYLLEPLYESALAMEQGQTGLTLGVLKGRQTGFTTGGMTLLLWHLDEHGGMSLHAVPTQKNAERFNSTILVPTLDDTTFRHIAPGTIWNQDVKAFKGDHSASYVLGHTLGGNQTAEGDGFRGLTAQVCLFDERGTMPEAACSVIESCLDVCATPIIWNVGSAGFRGDALDRFFRSGTRAEWVIPCQSCAKHTILVRYGDEVEAIGRCLGHDGYRWFYACEHCGREIDPGLGQWEHQDRDAPELPRLQPQLLLFHGGQAEGPPGQPQHH
jgi:hypothetical protein